MQERKTFVFTEDAKANLAIEARAANALEFIAHYLDRIEGHLEALADHARSGYEDSSKMAVALQGLQSTLNRIAAKP